MSGFTRKPVSQADGIGRHGRQPCTSMRLNVSNKRELLSLTCYAQAIQNWLNNSCFGCPDRSLHLQNPLGVIFWPVLVYTRIIVMTLAKSCRGLTLAIDSRYFTSAARPQYSSRRIRPAKPLRRLASTAAHEYRVRFRAEATANSSFLNTSPGVDTVRFRSYGGSIGLNFAIANSALPSRSAG